jgi:serine/threonine protein kinase
VSDGPPDLPGLVYERLLGSGGYSDVYLYRQQLPLRHVAVKVLKDSGLKEGLRSQLTAEANAMAGLADHPNIVPVISASISGDGRPYIVMTYYSRPNLAVRAASERLGVAEALRIGIQIASAVETAHRAGILHRDIKPANLLINQYGVPGLTDFGIAGTIAAEDDEDTGVSVPWSAPEVLYGTAPTSVRSDVYSLAATLWHLLVGRSPFEVRGGDNSAFELMRRVRDMPAPSTGRADVPDSLDRLLRQAMAKDPAARVATAIDFARGLQASEQELHLPRTEIVVLTERSDGGEPGMAPATGRAGAPPSFVSPPQAGAPPTVARPVSFRGQEPITSTPGLAAQGGSRAPLYDLPPAPIPPGSRRADAPPLGAPPGSPPGAAPRAHPVSPPPGVPGNAPARRPVVGIVVAVVLVAAAVVGAFLLFSGGSGSAGKPTHTLANTVNPTQDAGEPGGDVPPGTPTIVGQRTGGQVLFTWTYPAPLANDTFQVRRTGKPTVHTVTKPRFLVQNPGRRTCIRIRILRADGSNASPTFSQEGCA